jgi:hypothetical protein
MVVWRKLLSSEQSVCIISHPLVLPAGKHTHTHTHTCTTCIWSRAKAKTPTHPHATSHPYPPTHTHQHLCWCVWVDGSIWCDKCGVITVECLVVIPWLLGGCGDAASVMTSSCRVFALLFAQPTSPVFASPSTTLRLLPTTLKAHVKIWRVRVCVWRGGAQGEATGAWRAACASSAKSATWSSRSHTLHTHPPTLPPTQIHIERGRGRGTETERERLAKTEGGRV